MLCFGFRRPLRLSGSLLLAGQSLAIGILPRSTLENCMHTRRDIQFPSVIKLNVGGRQFCTHLSTLTKDPTSMLAAMFSGRHLATTDEDGRYFIDVDGDVFAHILNYLRFKKLPPADAAEDVHEYAKYFGIESLVQETERYQSVVLQNFITSVKSYYPKYEEIFRKFMKIIYDFFRSPSAEESVIVKLSRYVSDEGRDRTLTIPSYQQDPSGLKLAKVLKTDLAKRGFHAVMLTDGMSYEIKVDTDSHRY